MSNYFAIKMWASVVFLISPMVLLQDDYNLIRFISECIMIIIVNVFACDMQSGHICDDLPPQESFILWGKFWSLGKSQHIGCCHVIMQLLKYKIRNYEFQEHNWVCYVIKVVYIFWRYHYYVSKFLWTSCTIIFQWEWKHSVDFHL